MTLELATQVVIGVLAIVGASTVVWRCVLFFRARKAAKIMRAKVVLAKEAGKLVKLRLFAEDVAMAIAGPNPNVTLKEIKDQLHWILQVDIPESGPSWMKQCNGTDLADIFTNDRAESSQDEQGSIFAQFMDTPDPATTLAS